MTVAEIILRRVANAHKKEQQTANALLLEMAKLAQMLESDHHITPSELETIIAAIDNQPA